MPGRLDKSELVKRIFSDDPDEIMPPPDSHKVLTSQQKDLLKRWIAAGAEYQPLWSFIAPKRPVLSSVKTEAWVRNPIDRFILAKLEQNGLQPAPEADRRTLARRACLDLTGLPPLPEQVEEFVNDKAPDAYEKYVDRLLASPRYGEHRARYWLDAARYGDSNGIHFDNYREIWSFRSWVINAFNRNQPFDQFTIEQLAGDLLPNRTLDQQIASGFNRCNVTTNEGGAINEEYKVLYARDRTETTSQVWLGLTAGCAVCHDHKFDPLLQREFYQLSAYFNNTTQPVMDGNLKDTPPVVFVPQPADRKEWDDLAAVLPSLRQQMEQRKQSHRAEFNKWLAGASSGKIAAQVPSDGLLFHAPLNEGSGNKASVTVNGKPRVLEVNSRIAWAPGYVAEKSFKAQPGKTLNIAEAGDFDKNQPFTTAAWVKLTFGGQFGAIVARMDDQHDYRGWDLWMENDRLGCHIINHWEDDALKVLANRPIKPGVWNHLMVTYDGSGKAEGVTIYINGEVQQKTVVADRLKNTPRTTVPLTIAQRYTSSRLDGALIQDVRIYDRSLSASEANRLGTATRAVWLISKPASKRSKAEAGEIFDWWFATFDKPPADLVAKLTRLSRQEAAIKSRGTEAHVMQERNEPAMAYVLYRGEYDKRRDPVRPDTPAMLPPMPTDLPKNRLGLARWLVRPENPLTARVTANRFWEEVFGTGIIRTAGDFGSTGEAPSHPELLDWLAVEFRESGWDVKKFYWLMVTSAVYRQSALVTPEKLEKDPANRLLSRGPRFRMDAEMVCDYALAASGLLSPKIGGPSVKPYQPPGVWEAVAMPGGNLRNYVQDRGENLYRRSMYTLWKRAAPPASMEIFNAPSREVCTVRRERTNTPLQALVTLNDPQFVEAARVLAQRALQEEGKDPAARLDYIARRLLARPLRAEELAVAQRSLKELLSYYQTHAKEAGQLIKVGEAKADPTLDVPTLAAWAMLTNELMNLDEVLNK